MTPGRIGFICAASTLVLNLWAAGHPSPNRAGSESSYYSVVRDPVLPPNTTIGYIRPDVPDFKTPEYKGETYEALVPDTLDLAERARLAINALTEMLNPNLDQQLYFSVCCMADPPMMIHT